jgi:hypothetical protein
MHQIIKGTQKVPAPFRAFLYAILSIVASSPALKPPLHRNPDSITFAGSAIGKAGNRSCPTDRLVCPVIARQTDARARMILRQTVHALADDALVNG